MSLKYVFIILTTFAAAAQAWIIQSGDSKQWLMNQVPKLSVYEEMNNYFVATDPATDAKPYVKSFIQSMHVVLVQEAEFILQKKLNEPSCVPFANIAYPNVLTNEFNFSSKQKFEKEVLKIQFYDCLGKLDLNTVFETLMSESFQKQSIDGLKAIKTNQKNNQVCQTVSIFPFGTSSFCFTQNVLATKNQYFIHSFNEQNIDQPSAPAYYREAVTIITQLPNGEISLFNSAYARGPDLPFHSAVKNLIMKKQQMLIEKLILNAK